MKPFPKIDCERLHPSMPVKDVSAAVEFYTMRLGFTPGFTWPEDGPVTFAGVNIGEHQVFLEPRPLSPQGVAVYFVVGNVDDLCEAQRARGVTIDVEPGDRVYGLRDYTALDLDGNRLTFGHRTDTDCDDEK